MKFLLCILLPLCLFATQDEGYILASFEGAPESIIEDCVHAITGDLRLKKVDMRVESAESIELMRVYLSRLSWEKGGGWQLLPHTLATFEKEYPYILTLSEKNGGRRYFQPRPMPKQHLMAPKKKGVFVFALNQISEELGITNIAKGFPSARHNPMSYVLEMAGNKRTFKVCTPDGSCRNYERSSSVKDNLAHIYLLKSEQLPSKNVIHYTYDRYNRLVELKSTNPAGTVTYSSIVLTYQKNQIQAKASDGQIVNYHQTTFRTNYELITPFTDSEFSYSLQPRALLIKAKDIEISYYARGKNKVAGQTIEIPSPYDLRLSRVKTLKTKNGKTYHFIYTPEIPGRVGGKTEIIDEEGCKIKITFTPELRIQTLQRFDKNSVVVDSTKYVWDSFKLLAKISLDGSDKPLHAETFEYDSLGNVVTQRIFNTTPIQMKDELPHPKAEHECITFAYNQKNFLTKEESPLLTKQFSYLGDTDKIKAEILSQNDKIIYRKFYTYDVNNLLTGCILDNGNTLDPSDIKKVTYRNRMTYHLGANYLPEGHTEKRYDIKQNKEKLIETYTINYAEKHE